MAKTKTPCSSAQPTSIPDPEDRPTYLASDVAYVWNKLVDRKFDKAIYVWGADHHGDKPRVIAAARALGLDPSKVVIILYQLVTLKRGGELVRMSKTQRRVHHVARGD